jgi:hypothetical protein
MKSYFAPLAAACSRPRKASMIVSVSTDAQGKKMNRMFLESRGVNGVAPTKDGTIALLT